MLPGYIAPGLTMTSHIHLGVWGGSGFGSHGEPPYKFEHVPDRTPIPRISFNINRAWDGTPFDDVLVDEDDNPILFNGYEYILRVSSDDYDLLTKLSGRRLALVDILHCADDQSHTPYIVQVLMTGVEYSGYHDPMLTHNLVKVSFEDLNTVAPIA